MYPTAVLNRTEQEHDMTDPFSDARSGFVKLEDMLGRLVLVAPKSVEQRQSTLPGANGKTYDSIVADVVVLDGEPNEVIEEVPLTVEGAFISGAVIVNQLRAKVKTQGLVLGRLGQQPSRTKSFGPAWVLNPPTDTDKNIARGPAQQYLASQSSPFSAAG